VSSRVVIVDEEVDRESERLKAARVPTPATLPAERVAYGVRADAAAHEAVVVARSFCSITTLAASRIRTVVGEDPDDVGAAADLAVEALEAGWSSAASSIGQARKRIVT